MGEEVLGLPGTTPRASVDLASGADAVTVALLLEMCAIRLSARVAVGQANIVIGAGFAYEILQAMCMAHAAITVSRGDAPDARSTDGRGKFPGSNKTPPQVERREP